MKALQILLIEDNDADVFLAKKAFSSMAREHTIHVIMDGEEALQVLGPSEGDAGLTPRPDIIFLDLNLPKVEGAQILATIKQNPALAMIPVICLSSSKSDEDVRRVYGLYANAYISKPNSLDEYRQMVVSIENFWLRHAILPVHK